MRTTVRALAALVVAAVIGLGATGCGDVEGAGPGQGHSITIGAQTGLANQVIAHLYGGALADRGFTVDYNYGIGSRKSFLAALKSGMLDVVPDYAGSLLDAVDSGATAASTNDVMTRLPTSLEPMGLTVFDASEAQKSRAYVTTKQFATAHSLTSIGDLAPIASAITIGSSEQSGSDSTTESLSFSYGVSGSIFRSEPDDAAALSDLAKSNIQVADVSAIHLSSLGDDLVVLADPKHMVLAQNVVPVVRRPEGTAAVRDALNAVSAKLTTGDLADFAAADGQLPESIAEHWLKREGIVAG